MDRALRAGRVSFQVDEKGDRWIDPSEVARAFPETARHVPRDSQGDAERRAPETVETALLREMLERERAINRDLTAERDRLLGMLEQREQHLLPAPRRWWWWRSK